MDIRKILVASFILIFCVECKFQSKGRNKEIFNQLLPIPVPKQLNDFNLRNNEAASLCSEVLIVKIDNLLIENVENSILVNLSGMDVDFDIKNKNRLITSIKSQRKESKKVKKGVLGIEMDFFPLSDSNVDTIFSVTTFFNQNEKVHPSIAAILLNLSSGGKSSDDPYETIIQLEDEVSNELYYYNKFNLNQVDQKEKLKNPVSNKVIFLVEELNYENRPLIDFLSQIICLSYRKSSSDGL